MNRGNQCETGVTILRQCKMTADKNKHQRGGETFGIFEIHF